jgi:hypothetical protein
VQKAIDLAVNAPRHGLRGQAPYEWKRLHGPGCHCGIFIGIGEPVSAHRSGEPKTATTEAVFADQPLEIGGAPSMAG